MNVKKGDEAMMIPVATPVGETMVRNAVPPAPQPLYQAGAVSDVALSSGAECSRMGVGCNSRSYGIHTMQPNASGVPVRMHARNGPSMKVKFSGQRVLTIFDTNGTDFHLNRFVGLCTSDHLFREQSQPRGSSIGQHELTSLSMFHTPELHQIPQVRCWPHSPWLSLAAEIPLPRCILRLAAQSVRSDKTMGAGRAR
jgi:hypothetical protein